VPASEDVPASKDDPAAKVTMGQQSFRPKTSLTAERLHL